MHEPVEPINRRMRVLVVEDEPRLRDLLSEALPDMGFDVATVSRGGDALRVFEQSPPDIVLLDLHLPDMDGMALFETVHQTWPATQFIILTGFGTVVAAQQAIRLDVVDFLTKPASLGEIDIALDRARKKLLGAQALPEEVSVVEEATAQAVANLKDVERATILETLRRHDGNRAQTAKELGISVRTLYYRLSEYESQGFDIEGR